MWGGQRLKVTNGVSNGRTRNTGRYRIVKSSDTLQYLSYLIGYFVNYLAQKNGNRK